jgi:hypothetical protein
MRRQQQHQRLSALPEMVSLLSESPVVSSIAQSPARDVFCLGASTVGALGLVTFFKSLAVEGVIDQVGGWNQQGGRADMHIARAA